MSVGFETGPVVSVRGVELQTGPVFQALRVENSLVSMVTGHNKKNMEAFLGSSRVKLGGLKTDTAKLRTQPTRLAPKFKMRLTWSGLESSRAKKKNHPERSRCTHAGRLSNSTKERSGLKPELAAFETQPAGPSPDLNSSGTANTLGRSGFERDWCGTDQPGSKRGSSQTGPVPNSTAVRDPTGPVPDSQYKTER